MNASFDTFLDELHASLAAAARRDLHREIQRAKRLIAVVAQQAPDMLPEWFLLIQELERKAVKYAA